MGVLVACSNSEIGRARSTSTILNSTDQVGYY